MSAAAPSTPMYASPNAAQAFRRRIAVVARVMALIGGWNYVACALFICADVIGRNFFHVSSSATVEITGYMLAGGIAWSLGHTLAMRAHIRVDVLANRVPVRIRAWLHLGALTLLALFSVFVTWAAWHLVSESIVFDAHDNSALSVPMVVPQGIWAVGISAFMVMVATLMVESVLTLMAGRGEELDALLGARTFEDETAEALEAVAMTKSESVR